MEQSEINKDIFYHVNEIPQEHSASCGIPHSDCGIQNNTQSNVSINNKNNLLINSAISQNGILDKHETKYNPAIKHGKKVFSPNVKEIVAITYKIPISPIISETYKLNNDLLDIHRTLIETKYMYDINKNNANDTSASSTLLGGEMIHNTSIFPSTILNTELSYKLPSNYLESMYISSYIPNTTVTTGTTVTTVTPVTTATTEYSDSSDLADSSSITTVTTEKK